MSLDNHIGWRMKRIAEELGFPDALGFDIIETDYHGRTWYNISFPSFGFVDIERMVKPNSRSKIYERYAFSVAYCVLHTSTFWPIDSFKEFMDKVHKSKIDPDLVFSGPKPPFTGYCLDELLKKGYDYKKICNYLKKRAIPLRFNITSFCGDDATRFRVDDPYSPHYSRLLKYLEPPKEIKDIMARNQLEDAIKQLGVNKCLEQLKEWEKKE